MQLQAAERHPKRKSRMKSDNTNLTSRLSKSISYK